MTSPSDGDGDGDEMTTTTTSEVRPGAGFRHEALLYRGTPEFVHRTAAFVRDAVGADESILVVVTAPKIDLLRAELGSTADAAHFADMADVGTNPARIIPAWQDFVDAWGGPDRPVRGVGEPQYPERCPEEVVECEHHEALLNVAFAHTDLWLVCPYDTAALDAAVTDGVWHTHPRVCHDGVPTTSASYSPDEAAAVPHDALTPAPPHEEVAFDDGSFRDVRAFVRAAADRARLSPSATDDLALAASEAATNSVLHGGGSGVVGAWQTGNALVCQVTDRGWIRDPMAGRVRPTHEQSDGRGLWIINQVCDLVQLRSSPAGTTLRMHMRLAG